MMATRAIPDSGKRLASQWPDRWRYAGDGVPDGGSGFATGRGPGQPAPDDASFHHAPVRYAAAGYGPSRRARMWAIVAVVVLHVAAIGAILTYKVLNVAPPPPQAIALIDLAAPPPPAPPAPAPDLLFETPPVVVPPPVIEVAPTAPAITARVAETPPVPAAPARVAAPATASPGAAAPVAGADLTAGIVDMVPPRYPYESRRLKEQGVVILDVTLALDGRVDAIRVHMSSGYPRLDTAALEAVRRWRWSPTVRGGVTLAVRGLVEIPFVLSGRHAGRSDRRRQAY